MICIAANNILCQAEPKYELLIHDTVLSKLEMTGFVGTTTAIFCFQRRAGFHTA